ncbi:aldolase/citrate lyase family protein [Acrocarpospora macrocephala]|uniref:2,4-dihydroxyhept-2-ene-1,7-dioic acid aldolase n=1 Tax=Acrocarpospora macrocephala TaxID=150177 RepID=A0A5M3WYL4_9ACTN|nr:aldolase/citrate lyase family protein [Acrocarpospora macrocephala]GES12431.1 2,4-dihydroxyhept-2-ene-1,7-dioic acid aldolase [Acrocarpospora macrocephala]
MTNLRIRLKSGEPLLGTLITLDSPEVALILQRAGFAWFFLDLEHSALLDLKSAQRIIEVLQPQGYAVIRVPDNSETWIKHALDTGCDGVIIPHVGSRADAERAILFSKYPPLGRRSVGIARAQGYGSSFQDYLSGAAERIAVIAQIEDVDGVENVDDILAVEGIDAIFIGPYDLSGSMGILGQLTDPALIENVNRVRRACHAADVPFGIFCPNITAMNAELARKTSLLAVGSDTGHISAGAASIFHELRPER